MSNCPEYDDHTFETILAWAEAKVEWCDEFVDSRGNKSTHPEWAEWSLLWKHGVISFEFKQDEEYKARRAAAMFLYLWSKGVPACNASKIAYAFVKTWLPYRILK